MHGTNMTFSWKVVLKATESTFDRKMYDRPFSWRAGNNSANGRVFLCPRQFLKQMLPFNIGHAMTELSHEGYPRLEKAELLVSY
jgi:hypothetical protein